MLKKYLAERRGQVSILFALLMPIFLLFVGVALDLGWYYLNVSRLQNAADAAAVAGARTLIGNQTFADYKNISLVDKYPAKVSNEYRPADISEEQAIENVELVARKYVDKNLASEKYGSSIDAWTKNVFLAEPSLYEKGDNLYYVVKIREEIQHFFLSGWFDDMNAPVTAIAMLSKNSSTAERTVDIPTVANAVTPPAIAPVKPEVFAKSILDALEKAEQENVIVGNWEVQNIYKDINNPDTTSSTKKKDEETGEWLTEFKKHYGYELYTGNWNQYSDSKNHYTTGDYRRKENIIIKPTKNGSSLQDTKANGNRYYSEKDVDSLNIDFKPDVMLSSSSKYMHEDWDLILGYSTGDVVYNNDGLSGKDDKEKTNDPNALLRIHTAINFNDSYTKRNNAEDSYDILWVRIESETMLSEPDTLLDPSLGSEITNNKGTNGLRSFNSVRQLVVNINEANDGLTDRPVVIFYDGPERYSTDNSIRDSKPVIVNLNANFNGILYMPNSPVVLNDNDKNFNGFIVAKEYLALKTDSDFSTVTEGSTSRYFDNSGNEYYKIPDEHNNTMFIDSKGEVQYKSVDYNFNRKVGSYATFGRTDFSNYDYIINPTSANNLLIKSEEE